MFVTNVKIYDMFVPETNSQHTTYTGLNVSTTMTVLEYVPINNITYEYEETTESTQLSLDDQDIPIIIGVAVSAGVIMIIISILIIYKCCRHYQRKQQTNFLVTSIQPLDSDQIKVLGKIESSPVNFFYTRVTEPGSNKMPRSTSAPLKPTIPLLNMPKVRPRSQPGPVQGATYSSVDERKLASIQEVPKINIESHLCASANILDDEVVDLPGIIITQIENSCDRYRPVSAEVDLDQLYAKVNYIKKRKNRMRKDSAAAIAATKSRVGLTSVTLYHADTDILVENEAEVVYDERTSL